MRWRALGVCVVAAVGCGKLGPRPSAGARPARWPCSGRSHRCRRIDRRSRGAAGRRYRGHLDGRRRRCLGGRGGRRHLRPDRPDRVSYQVVRFSSDGSQLSVTSRNAIQVFQLPDGTLVQSSPSGIYGSSPDGTYQVETATGGFEVVRASDGAQVGIFQAYPVSDVTFAASNQLVAAAMTVYTHGASFATEEIWDVQTGGRLRLLPAFPPGTAGTFAIPANGDQVLTLDGTDAEVWCR